jgi:ribosomal protein S18 acetylase RimI-like enzyme
VPRTDDVAAIRALLQADRAWSIYPLGDLMPAYFAHTTWYRGPEAIVLLYRGVEPPVFFAQGEPGVVADLLGEAGPPPALRLHVRPEIVPVLRHYYHHVDTLLRWRMVLDREHFPESTPSCRRLTAADVPALERLYDDGEAAGERPEYFFPPMVTEGVFFGVEEGGELVAVAGTHLVSRAEGIGAVGNIYTRRNRRGRGLAGLTTSAVTAELLGLEIETIALNVAQTNRPALAVYQRLGYRCHCPFMEGTAAEIR